MRNEDGKVVENVEEYMKTDEAKYEEKATSDAGKVVGIVEDKKFDSTITSFQNQEIALLDKFRYLK